MRAVHWLAETANPGPAFDGGLELAEQHHLEDAGIAKLCRTLEFRRSRGIEKFLLAVAEKHDSREVQGMALLCLASNLKLFHDFAVDREEDEQAWLNRIRQHYSDDVIAWLRAAKPAELSARVDTLCAKIISEYGDVADDRNRSGQPRSLADAANAVSFSLHAVGSIAPEMVGPGVDGSRVRLADLRGKVVLLMFSANWCGPCKLMYGQLRELMETHAERPFSVITIMADRQVSTVSQAVRSGEITWPVIWDGDNGPIARDWHTTSYPTIYLIDPDGRIKSRDLREDALDDEVASMLGIDPESRVKVDKRTRVWELSLRKKNVTGDQLPSLLEGYTELRSLDLSYNALSDEDLKHLQPLTKLETIRLEHTGISDRGLQHLKKLPNLKRVRLYLGPGHRTTKPARRRLQREMPGLQITFITS